MGKRAKVDGDRLEFIPPQMPSLVEQPPEDEGWVHEAKLDGYRTQIIIDKGGVRFYNKNGRDWTTKYWPIALAVELPCRGTAILDGEVIVSGERGTPDSPELEAAIWMSRAGWCSSRSHPPSRLSQSCPVALAAAQTSAAAIG
ncbi:ATP-dependent DNA ligase [Mesorhizobium silamurunense]|uniref:ATP-dependent DNA ligase n=1 Tax=Mesorhizobium silamurunense TaxID=499528 RepID=UPI0024845A3F|nr:hypothetical protein [Mesorhizobium silamurunense]